MKTRYPLIRKVILVIFLATMLPIFLQNYLVVRDEVGEAEHLAALEVERALNIIAITAAEPLWSLSDENLAPILKAALANEFIQSVRVFHRDGRAFLQESSRPHEGSGDLLAKAPVLRDGKEIGYIEIGYSFAPLKKKRRDIVIRHTLHSFLLLAIVLGFLSGAIYYFVLKPISLLYSQAEILSNGDFSKPFSWPSTDEIANVGTVLENMRKNTLELVAKLEAQNAELTEKVKEKSGQVVQSAKMAALGEMAGGIAHEINNPMHIIHGRVEILQDMLQDGKTLDYEKARAALERIAAMVFRVSRIIKVMRSLSRKTDTESLVDVSLKAVVADAFDLCQERLRNVSIELRNELRDDVIVKGVPGALAQVLLNLIGNSKDAIEKLPDPWISVSAESAPGKVRLRVTDSGAALDPEFAKKIMEPFFTTKEVGKGTGLGLSISRTIMRNGGGDLYFEAQGGHTSFVMEFPAS